MPEPTINGRTKQLVTPQHLVYASVILVSIVLGTLAAFVDSVYLIAGALGVVVIALIVRFEYFGLILYLLVFLLRPGETYPALDAIRLELLLGGSLGVITLMKNKFRYGRLTLPNSRLNIDFLLLIAAMVASLPFAVCKDCTVGAIMVVVKLAVFYLLIILQVDSEKRLVLFFWVFILANAQMSFDITVGFFQGQVRDFAGLDRAIGGSSAMDNFNGIAITMNTIIPFTYYLFLHYRSHWKKAIMGLLLALFVLTLILTGSRGGLLGFLAILGFIWWGSRRKALLAFAMVLILSVGWFVIEDERRARYTSIISSAEERDASAQGRIESWIDGLYLFASHPLTGVGAGSFAWARLEQFGTYLQAHSLYVQVLAELGVIGTILYFMFLTNIIRISRNTIRQVRNRGSPFSLQVALAQGTIVACFSLLITGIFAHSAYRYTWYLLAALTVVGENLLKRDQRENHSSETRGNPLPIPATGNNRHEGSDQ